MTRSVSTSQCIDDDGAFEMRSCAATGAREQPGLRSIEVTQSHDGGQRVTPQHIDAPESGFVLIDDDHGLQVEAWIGSNLKPARTNPLDQLVHIAHPLA